MRVGIWDGIWANSITTSLMLLFAIICAILHWIKQQRRKKLLRFFGITKKKLSLKIFTSRLEVLAGGTRGTIDIRKGYVGPAIVQIEYEAAIKIQREIGYRPLTWLSRSLNDWLAGKNVLFATLDLPIEVAPPHNISNDEVETFFAENLLIIGAGVYNRLASELMDRPASFFYFKRDANKEQVVVKRNKNSEDQLLGRSINRELCIIQRITNPKNGNKIVLCAGTSSGATYGGVKHLSESWEKLQGKYDEKDFGCCYAFYDMKSPDVKPYSKPDCIWENKREDVVEL